MKIVIGAVFGALALAASPAQAQSPKAGAVAPSPPAEQRTRAYAKQHQRPAASPFYKAGTVNFQLEPPANRASSAQPHACCQNRTDTNPS